MGSQTAEKLSRLTAKAIALAGSMEHALEMLLHEKRRVRSTSYSDSASRFEKATTIEFYMDSDIA